MSKRVITNIVMSIIFFLGGILLVQYLKMGEVDILRALWDAVLFIIPFTLVLWLFLRKREK